MALVSCALCIQASLIIRPRSLRCSRNALQPALPSLAPSQMLKSPDNPLAVAHLASPAALEHDAVQIDVGRLAFDWPVAPRFDRPVDLLFRSYTDPPIGLISGMPKSPVT